jgi:hypothetical protein
MRRLDLLNEYSTVISPALAPHPWPFRPAETAPRRIRLPMAGTGSSARRPWLRPAVSLVISIALIAVFQF